MEGEAGKKGEGSGLFDLTGRVGLVTGGGGGFGRVFCEALAEFGADVAVADIVEEGARQTAWLVKKLGRRSAAVKADVSDPAGVQFMVSETVAKLGRIDILINNAGISAKPAKIAEMSIEEWDKVIAVNLRGVFLCTRAALPVMVKQKKGNIINIASVRGIRPTFEIVEVNPKAHYTAAKGAVISLTKETALEYVKDGIRVNCIAPGHHAGTRLGRWRDGERQRGFDEMMASITPMGRAGDPNELKGLLIYLASDASSFVTGQVFVSAGGRCL